jgi:hypothetical protein
MYYLLPTTQKVEKITEFVFESIPKFISIIWENIWWIWDLPFIYTILKASVSTVVMRHFFANNSSQLFQINPLHIYRCQTTPDTG